MHTSQPIHTNTLYTDFGPKFTDHEGAYIAGPNADTDSCQAGKVR